MALAACGDSTSPSTGSLAVTVSAISGTSGTVTVSGPGGYSKTLTATTTLSGLVPGSYTVTGAPAVSTDAVVGNDTSSATVSGSPATVAKNQTATVTVTYGVSAMTGGLWIGNLLNTMSPELVEFGASQLGASGTPTPVASIVGQNTEGEGVALAFDRSGNLWTVNEESNQITEYTAAQQDSANPTAVLTLTIQNGRDVEALAFDSAGNLWMADPGPCEFYAYKASTLAAHSGAVTLAPDVVINPGCHGSSGPVENPTTIAFDANWNMWVGDNGNDDIYEYQADSLVSGFSGLTYLRTIYGLYDIGYMAFDASGNLWSSGEDSLVYEFSTSQLADTTSHPTAHTTVSLASGTQVEGIAFDNSGNLWGVDAEKNNVYELSTSQLASGGAVATPAVTLGANANSLFGPYGIAFEPHASGLPLFAKVPKVPRTGASKHAVGKIR
jgi:hypothetical protein